MQFTFIVKNSEKKLFFQNIHKKNNRQTYTTIYNKNKWKSI